MQKHIHAENFTISDTLQNFINQKIDHFVSIFPYLQEFTHLHINMRSNAATNNYGIKISCSCSKIRSQGIILSEENESLEHAINSAFKQLYTKFNNEKEILQNQK